MINTLAEKLRPGGSKASGNKWTDEHDRPHYFPANAVGERRLVKKQCGNRPTGMLNVYKIRR